MTDFYHFKCGFVAIIGKPNVGKSTLMNSLIKEKLSIVTPKPQTTRQNIKGIYNTDNLQIIFLDTPGYVNPRYELHLKMLEYISKTIDDADVIIYLTDHKFPTEYDKEVLKALEKTKKNTIAIINKKDLIPEVDLDIHMDFLRQLSFRQVISISALYDKDLTNLIDILRDYLPWSPPLFPQDELSDLPVRFFAQEIVREKIFLLLKDEIPYSSAVVVEKFIETEDKVEIFCNIWLERKSQKIILIGREGKQIKKIRELSEKDLTDFLQKKTLLHIWVKIKQNWRKQKNSLREFGYT